MSDTFDTDTNARSQADFEGAVVEPTGSGNYRPTAASVYSRSPRTPWTAEHYSPLVTRSGAMKLANSGVAPIIVAARGYESVDEAASKDFAKRWDIGDGRSKRGSQFLNSFRDDGDILVMPWYRADSLKASAEDFERVSPSSIQMRPQNPRTNEKGKSVKYEFLVGQDTVLDYHPAVTRAWVNSAPRTMLAEGLLKGDASLTAQLRSADENGVRYISDDELFLSPSDQNRVAAMKRLDGLLERIPQTERVAILSLAGVGNWRSNSEWNTINLREREVLIAFDGDVNDNWNVWNMAKQLFDFIEQSKKGIPGLVSIQEFPGIEAVLALEPHLGLDDFFHHVGDWSDISEMLIDGLPQRPEKPDEMMKGEWRVSRDGTFVEECAPVVDSQGTETGVRWERRIGLGGRVKFSETRRAATDEELITGVFGAGVDESQYAVDCAVEVKWTDPISGDDVVAEVRGPHSILGYAPADWDRRGAKIPKELMFHPEWPPKKGPEWLQAIKKNEAQLIEARTTWATMGWVPVEGEVSPAFIIGDHVLATTPDAAKRVLPGVKEQALSGASKFGVSDVYTGENFTDPTGKHNLVEDLNTLINVLVEEGPWLRKQIAVTMLALGIRPAVPTPTSCSAYFVGAPGKGKSWSAKQIMSFWQARKGTWKDTLPGSANDTFASTENAVARTPIWVADDLAPSPDRRKAEQMETNIAELIRAVFNKLGRRRMNQDMTAKEVPTPMAVFILTAENESSVQSIRERVVNVEFTGLNDSAMDKANALSYQTLTAARVTAAVIRMFIQRGERDGWENMMAELGEHHQNGLAFAKEIMVKQGLSAREVERPSEIAADLSLGLVALAWLAKELGQTALVRKFGWTTGKYGHLLAEQVSTGHQGKSDMAPGKVLIDSIRGLLASGVGHIANIDDPNTPPIKGGEDESQLNSLLGWQMDGQTTKPRGTTLGWFTQVKTKGSTEIQDVIVLSRDDAFNLAQQKYPKRIQFGASQNTSWKNAWDLDLIHPAYVDKRPASGVVIQFRSHGGRAKISGVPVSIDTLFPNDANSDSPEGINA
jgi:hypothetical protein